MRYLMWIAEFSESSKSWTHIALTSSIVSMPVWVSILHQQKGESLLVGFELSKVFLYQIVLSHFKYREFGMLESLFKNTDLLFLFSLWSRAIFVSEIYHISLSHGCFFEKRVGDSNHVKKLDVLRRFHYYFIDHQQKNDFTCFIFLSPSSFYSLNDKYKGL